MRARQESPLATHHIAGEKNFLGDIPSRSFGYKAAWHFDDEIYFLTFFNALFPLPSQKCWEGYRLSKHTLTKVISVFQMGDLRLDTWQTLRP